MFSFIVVDFVFTGLVIVDYLVFPRFFPDVLHVFPIFSLICFLFLSQFLTTLAVGRFDVGPAAAFSLIYFLIILLFCFVFYTVIQNVGKADTP